MERQSPKIEDETSLRQELNYLTGHTDLKVPGPLNLPPTRRTLSSALHFFLGEV